MVLPNITLRLFMKCIGAHARTTALPKSVSKALSGVSTEGVKYAPPWVYSLVGTLKKTPLHTADFNFAKFTKFSLFQRFRIFSNF